MDTANAIGPDIGDCGHIVRASWQAIEQPEFIQVNTVLGNLKTAIAGTYHAFKFDKYADRHLAEVQYRFNRRFDLRDIFGSLLRAAALTAPRPMPSIRLAEVGRKSRSRLTRQKRTRSFEKWH